MSALYQPHLEVLPPAQRRLWNELVHLPQYLVLYGGTAIALRLGGRQSVDYDFFSSKSLNADLMRKELAFLHHATLIQEEPNTATFIVERNGPVKVSFFGGLTFGRVGTPELATGIQLQTASLPDLGVQKVKVVQARAEVKDYLDVALLIKSGLSLPDMLGYAQALYPQFAPIITLKALNYFGDGDLSSLPASVRSALITATAAVTSIPTRHKLAETLH